MRLTWITDPHLNHADPLDWNRWVASIASHGADGVVITGDISEGDDVVVQLRRLADSISAPIFFVLGNHDFYHSSFAATRQQVVHVSRQLPRLNYLTDCGPIALNQQATVVLVGEDGWADASEGDYEGSFIQLNDFRLIDDFRSEDPAQWKQHLHQLGSEAAARLRAKLESVHPTAAQVIIATHVPPFCEACWYQGHTTDANWAPFFVCGQVGQVLLSHARQRPNQQFTVLCGHTHHDGVATMSDNLVVHTGAAQYGQPTVEAMVNVFADGVEVQRLAS